MRYKRRYTAETIVMFTVKNKIMTGYFRYLGRIMTGYFRIQIIGEYKIKLNRAQQRMKEMGVCYNLTPAPTYIKK